MGDSEKITIIVGGGRSGKTIQLIKQSHETGCYIVCMNEREALRVFDESKRMKLNIPFPITFDEFRNRNYYSKGVKGLLIDNAEKLLQEMSSVQIDAITVNENK